MREKFLGYFFARTFALDNALERIGQLIVDYYKDPHNVQVGHTKHPIESSRRCHHRAPAFKYHGRAEFKAA